MLRGRRVGSLPRESVLRPARPPCLMLVFGMQVAFTSGFVIAAAAVAFGHSLWARWRRPAPAVAPAPAPAAPPAPAPEAAAAPPAHVPEASAVPPAPVPEAPAVPPAAPVPPKAAAAQPRPAPTPVPPKSAAAMPPKAPPPAAVPSKAPPPLPFPGDLAFAVRQEQARANLRDLEDRVGALICLAGREGYPCEFRAERDAARAAMQALAVQCPKCLSSTFDESGSNDKYLRFKCNCEPGAVTLVLRYKCMWRRPPVAARGA